ncbi:centromere protein Chl4/mis15/CENP-N [Nemania sp. FL0916]|nr:centromere protein Chl4/mis15/CENP-N [Nemania sp. FL0916]
MAPPLSLPTTARLPSSLRVNPSNPSVIKALSRLSRPSLLSLVLDWLDPNNQSLCPPFLRENASDEEDEEDDFAGDLYPPAVSLEELRELYSDMQTRKGSRREVVDRILEGDWRQGLSLYQLAMADLQYLYDHPGTLKWACFQIQRLQTPDHEDDVDADGRYDKIDRTTMHVPRFHPSTFLQNLQAEVLPDVKAHYNFDRPKGLPLLLLRIFVLDSPYNTDLAVSATSSGSSAPRTRTATSFDASRTIYVAFPDASPHIFVSKSQSAGPTTQGETRSLRALVVEGIPKALSRPRERYALRPVNLNTKNLDAMLSLRGPGRSNAAAGGWGVYAGDKAADARTHSPLNPLLPTPPLSDDAEPVNDEQEEKKTGVGSGAKKRAWDPETAEEEKRRKRARLVARARFGDNAMMDDGKGIERLDVLVEDPYPISMRDIEDDENHIDANHSRPLSHRPKPRRSGIDASLLREAEEENDDPDARTRNHPEEIDDSLDSPTIATRRRERDRDQDGDRDKWTWRPRVRLSFHGPHVFAGIRQLVEAGVIDGARMPGWMTGEDGVTRGVVRNGRIAGFKGSGL